MRPRARPKVVQVSYGSRGRAFSTTPTPFATHRDTPPSSLLSQTLDQRQQAARDAQTDTAGPFMLGTIQRTGPKQKKWGELSTKGKAIRSTQNTTNFTVIALGAGFTAMLAYALLSELFARNSPTVKFNEASKLIKESEAARVHLPGKLIFHNNPPSAHRPKHRNRRVSSRLMQDSAGREHLLLNFYVHAEPLSESGEGYIARTLEALKSFGEETWTWEEMRDWANEKARSTRDSARRLFLYLSGESDSGSSGPSYPFSSGTDGSSLPAAPTTRRETHIGRNTEEGGGLWSSIAGMFSGIVKSTDASSSSGESGARKREEIFEEGEIHCDLVKDEDGNYVWRYIIVDMPNSRARYPKRVFVKRAPGVRDYEGVLRWY
ncbi:uncharacterized protein FOMMEDRAFT_19598 [Fomitiporia mediterranea MF3/22]|uniref:uncharacterized protein n=1 Tax=Fomitiporia mediterranea (strain MF3/22) TaxID=694068 RepID=UPI0004409C1A|nr:uncharacterized protein FOMMEDRAFT_19598 [Fomitiporia mediterranea MF3/22]EJD04345.1 hypothetical protein FOMMEDRAFT_19598 [Fomitiporia mediterranea MF3/22]